MQTFLPSADFWYCASVLDRLRLGKQRVEVLQILRTLSGVSKGWFNHPAVRMWRGYECALALYGVTCCAEWVETHGYKDTCRAKICALVDSSSGLLMPPWLGNERLHSSHRAMLLYKDPEWYGRFGWAEQPAVPDKNNKLQYYWPV